MLTLQVTLETPILGSGFRDDINLLSVFGLALHRFGGGAIDSFFQGSIPAQMVLRVPWADGRSAFRVGAGFNIFWLPEDAFEPLVTEVETGGFEAALGGSIGFEFKII